MANLILLLMFLILTIIGFGFHYNNIREIFDIFFFWHNFQLKEKLKVQCKNCSPHPAPAILVSLVDMISHHWTEQP